MTENQKQDPQAKTEALAEVRRALKILDGLADEEWIAEGFLEEALILESGGRLTVDFASIIYALNEMGERQLALEFESELEKTWAS